MTTAQEDITELQVFAKPKKKFTIIIAGGGRMGADSKMHIVTRGWVSTTTGPVLGYSEPRGRKIYHLMPLLRAGAIVLYGHIKDAMPIFEGDVSSGGIARFVLDGKGGRFVDAAADGGASLIAFLKEHLVLHTISDDKSISLIDKSKGGDPNSEPYHPDFKDRLLQALGSPVEVGPPTQPKTERKELLTPKMKEELQSRGDAGEPLVKIFMPEGAATWVICGMESDGDTLWAVCDLGQGYVEYGTVSLRELETRRGPRFGLPAERDRFFNGKEHSVKDLMSRSSLSGI